MISSHPPNVSFQGRIFEERSQPEMFDFYEYTAANLFRIADRKGFIHSHDLTWFLGRRYCMRKTDVKKLVKTLKLLGYLKIKKRGVCLT